ncbi:hypothetical protein M0805_005946 [Coniferiporia weirii]|nr:hypothetical protein M0805_005946 [Coniferiporia weirii]
MFPSQLTTLLVISFGCLLRLASAVPLTTENVRRDVADPPVTTPNSTTVWVVGETQTVVWDTSNLPSQITNTNGTVLLGFINDTTSGEHLMTGSPLATGFDIRSGSVNIVVPDVEPRTDYIVALLGDSGNISGLFTIKNQTSSATSQAGPGSTSSTSAVVSTETTQTGTTSVAPPASATSPVGSVPSDPTTVSSGSEPSNSTVASSTSAVLIASSTSDSSLSSVSPSSSGSSSAAAFQSQTSTTSAGFLRAQVSSSCLMQFAVPFLAFWLFI